MNVTTDKMASELISKSLSGSLSRREREALERYQAGAKESQAFSRFSAMIERSVEQFTSEDSVADSGVQGALAGLSDVAKERMKRSIREEKRRSRAEGSELRVAEQETAYFTSDVEGMPSEQRHGACRFTLLHKIGEGGLGTVWLARDEKLRRNVALKEMNQQAAESPKLWQRFQREAEITGHLEHPNVVPLYVSGVNPESGLPFYVMRFLGKQTLAEAIREYHARREAGVDDAIDLHRLLAAFMDVCQAIAFAHSRGVVHRDLKPENVALDSFGQVLVLDWGLAKLDSDGELSTRLALSGGSIEESALAQTMDGDVVGTPLYMAPEQAAGDLNHVDSRTDVYGLGAILFAILTGNAPHENSHKASDGTLRVQDLLTAIAESETPRPRDFNPSVPRDLESICLRAMASQKFARHASATELADEVERWIAGKHRKEASYDAMRMTGRDLRSRLCVQLRQLAASAQFMVELPPIQGLLSSVTTDESDFHVWRDRLAKILLALAKSRPHISALSYARVADDRIREFVRVERSLRDVANIRSLPQSRLRDGVASTFHKTVLQQFPGECNIDFDCTTAGTVRIVCGVPVFDQDSEEPFGLVCAEAEIGNLVRPELELINSSHQVYLVDDSGNLLFSSGRADKLGDKMATQSLENWDVIFNALSSGQEFLDPDRERYATRLAAPQKDNSINIVFERGD